MADSRYIFDVTSETFDTYVLQNSHQVPVLVDFWAGWCQPCQMLMPVLARLIEEYDGKVLLAKVNSDEQQELAGRFGVRSLPTVKVFKEGRVVDEFMGVQPEPAIREIIERHVVRESDLTRAEALRLAREGDIAGAEKVLRDLLAADPGVERAKVDLASILAQTGRADEADELMRTVPLNIQQEEDVKALMQRIKAIRLTENAPDTEALRQAIEKDPADLHARLQLAARLVADDQLEDALEQYLEIMKRDRKFENDAGREGMLSVFEMLGGQGELVSTYRRKMAAMMY
ncbi:MAG TPA: thioredoxin [Thioalkalivibrio sp.]|nr:thioredoxin [Thioalkalivibrio sp.]